MGAVPYSYFVRYEEDLNAALQKLRTREFQAGRYYPARDFLNESSPGPAHDTIDEARADALESGTRSILDLDHLSSEPEFCAVTPLDEEQLLEIFETTEPTREMVEESDELWTVLERGHGICLTVYADGKPAELYFAGYSFD